MADKEDIEEKETRGSTAGEEKDVEEGLREGWFAGVGMNAGTVKKVKVLESYLITKGIIQ